MSADPSLRTRFDALPGPLRGAVWMVLASLCLSGMAASVRTLSADMHTFEIVFFRTMLGLPFMAPWLLRTRFTGLQTRNLRLFALRGVAAMVATTSFFWGLSLIPLAEATAIMFTRPLFATIFATVVLHEAARGRRWTAMGAGFVGVLIMVRPGFAEISTGVFLILIASLVAAGVATLIRYLSRTESPDTITIYYAIFMTLFSIGPALFVWQTPSWEQTMWILVMGFLGTLGQRAMARSFAAADISVVFPVDYLRLLFAAALGFVLFAEQPVVWTWIGGTVIFVATALLTRSESRRAR